MQYGSDHGIFVIVRKSHCIYLAIYVNDLLVMEQRDEDIKEVKGFLKQWYKMNDLGLAKQFLRMDIEYRENGAIKLHLKQYLSGLLKQYRMQDCNLVSISIDSSMKLVIAIDGDALVDPKEYQ